MATVILPDAFESDLNSSKCTHAHRKSFEKLLLQLQSAEISHGTNRERLKASDNVWSFRLGKKARVLATPCEVGGEQAWVMLELLPEHEYTKARFLKRGTVDRYLQKHFNGEDSLDAGECLTGSGGGGGGRHDDHPSSAPIQPMEGAINDGCIIQYSDTQTETIHKLSQGLSQTSYMALVAGAPGSGKTAIAYELIEQLVADRNTQEHPVKITYLAQSEDLRTQLQEHWHSSPLCDEKNKDCVSQSDYHDLLVHCGALAPDTRLAGLDDIRTYFGAIQSKQKKLQKAHATTATTATTTTEKHHEPASFSDIEFEQFYQECLVMAGTNNLDEYRALGTSHSLYHGNTALQTQLWEAFQAYRSDLDEQGIIDLKLCQIPRPAEHEADRILFVDEALDLSRAQLLALMNFGYRIVFAGDYNQDLTHTSNTIEFLKQRMPTFKLNHSYRCMKNISNVANFFLGLVKKVMPHGSDIIDLSIQSALEKRGRVKFLNHSNIGEAKRFCQSTTTAVICHDHDKAKLKGILGEKSLLMTVSEIKGLGYERIILWDIIDEATAARLLALSERKKVKRADLTQDDRAMLNRLHHLFTAITRAKVEVLFMQSKSASQARHVKKLYERMQQEIDLREDKADKSAQVKTKSSDSDWRSEADRLRKKGLSSIADNIVRQVASAQATTKAKAPQPSTKAEPKKTRSKSRPTTEKSSQPLVELAAPSLPLKFTVEGKGKGKRKKTKRKHSTTIDFSKPLHASQLKILHNLSDKQYATITNHHFASMLVQSLHEPNCIHTLITMMGRLSFQLAHLSISDFDDFDLSNIQPDSVIYHLIERLTPDNEQGFPEVVFELAARSTLIKDAFKRTLNTERLHDGRRLEDAVMETLSTTGRANSIDTDIDNESSAAFRILTQVMPGFEQLKKLMQHLPPASQPSDQLIEQGIILCALDETLHQSDKVKAQSILTLPGFAINLPSDPTDTSHQITAFLAVIGLHQPEKHSYLHFKQLMQRPEININAGLYNGNNPLAHAAQRAWHFIDNAPDITDHYKTIVSDLLQAGATLQTTQTSERGENLLHIACALNMPELVEACLQHGFDINSRDTYKQTPIIWATMYHSNDAFDTLLLHAEGKALDLSATGHRGTPAVLLAAESPSRDDLQITIHMTSALLQAGAPILGARTDNQFTLLHYAAQHDQPAWAQAYLDKGGNINAQATMQYTALHIAILFNSKKVAALLCTHQDIDFNVTDNIGNTAFGIAALQDNQHAIALLPASNGPVKADMRSLLQHISWIDDQQERMQYIRNAKDQKRIDSNGRVSFTFKQAADTGLIKPEMATIIENKIAAARTTTALLHAGTFSIPAAPNDHAHHTDHGETTTTTAVVTSAATSPNSR